MSLKTLRRARMVIASCVVLVTALAWAYLVQIDRRMSPSGGSEAMMANMGMVTAVSWGANEVFLAFVMWAVMMVGMMTAPAAPVFLLFAQTRSATAKRGVSLPVLLFGLGYITVWAGFSVCAAVTQWALHQAALLSPAMSASSPYFAGAILIAAGIYQMTPLKRACLTQCQSPLGFLMGNWREGNGGAFMMGLHHGAYCLGCCWALMLVLFAVGIMNLAWVAVLAAFILIEKIAPSGALVSRIGGAMIIALGIRFMVT
jgi:predicted metal-binding membrane protein